MYERSETLSVEAAHPSKVAAKMAVSNKVIEHGLIHTGGTKVGASSERYEDFDERRWQYDVSEAQRGEQELGKRSDKNHVRVSVKTLQGGCRQSFEPVFAVIVVFDDEGSFVRSPVQDLHPSLERQCDSKGILVSWGEKHSLGIGTGVYSGGNRDALFINGHGDDLCARSPESNGGTEISRVFHPDRISCLDQNAGQQIERLLRARNDYDLIRLAANPTRRAEIVRDGFAQRPIAASIILPP